MQASLERVGLDASKAIARARSRSVSRVGRKRERDASAGAGEAMEVDGSQAPEKKRIHSSKSRCCTCWHTLPILLLVEWGQLTGTEVPQLRCNSAALVALASAAQT